MRSWQRCIRLAALCGAATGALLLSACNLAIDEGLLVDLLRVGDATSGTDLRSVGAAGETHIIELSVQQADQSYEIALHTEEADGGTITLSVVENGRPLELQPTEAEQLQFMPQSGRSYQIRVTFGSDARGRYTVSIHPLAGVATPLPPIDESGTCSFAVYEAESDTPATSLDIGDAFPSRAGYGILTIENTGERTLVPTVKVAGARANPWGHRPAIPAGERAEIYVIWSMGSYDIIPFKAVDGGLIEANLQVGATCGTSAATNPDSERLTEIDLSATWNDPFCRYGFVSVDPPTQINNSTVPIRFDYDPSSKTASQVVTFETRNIAAQTLRMRIRDPLQVLDVGFHPDTGYLVDGIAVERFSIATIIDGTERELTEEERTLVTAVEPVSFSFKITIDMDGIEPGDYGTSLSFFGFDAVSTEEGICGPRPRVLPFGPSIHLFVHVPASDS